MTYPKTKAEIVKLILADSKENPDFPWKDFSIDRLVFDWFVTGRSGNGLRLTDVGMTAFSKANIAHYDFEFTPPGNTRGTFPWSKFTLVLDKKVKCPYYVGMKIVDNGKKQPYIRLYDNKIAMMFALYGDLESYINSVK